MGKSSLIPHLESKLVGRNFVIHDFDERGVPDNADREWRQSETIHWVQVGKENQVQGISTVICGYSKPAEIKEAEEKVGVKISICLLDANEESIRTRLTNRHENPGSLQELSRITGKTPEKFIEDNVWVSSQFREASKEAGYFVLDTSSLTPEQVAEEIGEWINK